MKITQRDRVLMYLKAHGSITAAEAFTDLGVGRLASRINELRKTHIINTVLETRYDRSGVAKTYARYSLGDDDG